MAGQLSPELRLRRLRLAGLAALLLVAAAAAVAAAWARALSAEPRLRYVVRPDEPVFGVSVGSPVRLRGAVVGEVSAVRLWAEPGTGRLRPEIALSLDPRRSPGLERLAELVAEGLRVEFVPVNPASGFLEVNLTWRPGSPLARATREPDELPAAPSAVSGVGRTAAILQSLSHAEALGPRSGLADRLDAAERALGSPAERAARLAAAAAEIRSASESLEAVAGAEAIGRDRARLAEARERLAQVGQRLAAFAAETGEADVAAPARLRELAQALRAVSAQVRGEPPAPAGDR